MKWMCALALVAFTGCADQGIGRKCVGTDGGTGIQIASPSLECLTRLCLIHQPKAMGDPPRAVCTITECKTDDDCKPATIGKPADGLCDSNFVCAVAAVAGPFACKKACVCKSDLLCGYNSDADGGVITPAQCPSPSPTPSCN